MTITKNSIFEILAYITLILIVVFGLFGLKVEFPDATTLAGYVRALELADSEYDPFYNGLLNVYRILYRYFGELSYLEF